MARELMKSFPSCYKEYMLHRSEESSANLLRTLQSLSASSDVSVFDPGSSQAAQFFICVHELLECLDARTTLVWSVVAVLQEACRNPEARQALVNVYKFCPVLTKLLGLQLSVEKRLKVLRVLQELTYGVKISWLEAHLPHLISMLCSWITGQDAELVPVSLSVLVNLCHKNLPAIYSLMRTIDVKHFLKSLLKLQRNDNYTRIQVCQLLCTLECISGGIPESEINSYVRMVCPIMVEGLKNQNACLMRQVLDFFKEMFDNHKISHIILSYPNYPADLETVIGTVETEESTLSGDCLAVVFEFLSWVLEKVASAWPVAQEDEQGARLLGVALRWVRTEQVSAHALALLTTVASLVCSTSDHPSHKDHGDSPPAESVIDILDKQLDVILLLLNTGNESLGSSQSHKKMTALVQLLSEMIRVPSLCNRIIKSVNYTMLRNLFAPVLNPAVQEDNNMFQQSVYTFYVQALCFLVELVKKETNLHMLYDEMLQSRQITLLLATALLAGPDPVKRKVLHLIGTTGVSEECLDALAANMTEVNKFDVFSPVDKNDPTCASNSMQLLAADMHPPLSSNQESQLNNILEKYEQIANKNQENSVTSAMMELYQYKMASMAQSLAMVQKSQEVTDTRVRLLQHRMAYAREENSRLHQLLNVLQHSYENKSKEVDSLTSRLQYTQKQANETHNKFNKLMQNLKSKTLIINEQNEEIEKLNHSLKEKQAEKVKLQSKIAAVEKELEHKTDTLHKVEDNLKEMQDKNSGMENLLEQLESSLESAKQAGIEYKKEIASKNEAISLLENDIAKKNEELEEERKIRESINRLLAQKH